MEAKHTSLMYLSYVAMNSDGKIQVQEDRMLNKIFEIENVSKDSIAEFNRHIKTKSLTELRKIGLEGFMNAHRQDQIKTLAWIHKMIYADDEVDVKEAQFLMQSIKPTDISYEELIKVAESLPDI